MAKTLVRTIPLIKIDLATIPEYDPSAPPKIKEPEDGVAFVGNTKWMRVPKTNKWEQLRREVSPFRYNVFTDGTVSIEQTHSGALALHDYAAIASGLKALIGRHDEKIMNHRRYEMVLKLRGHHLEGKHKQILAATLALYDERKLTPSKVEIWRWDDPYPDYRNVS